MRKQRTVARHLVNARLPRTMVAKLYHAAKQTPGLTVTAILEEAVGEWIDRVEAGGRQLPDDLTILDRGTKADVDDARPPSQRVRDAMKKSRKR